MPALQIVSNPFTALTADELVDHYCESCGMKRLPWMKPEFSQLLAEGFTPQLLDEIISKTAHAPRPSWAYLLAIVGNCRTYGVYKLDDFHLQKPKKHHENQQDYY